MRVLIDMNLSPAWVPVFARHGLDALHWAAVGASGAPDAEIFAWARTHTCIVFTHDLDFGMILAASGDASPSVVQVRDPAISPARDGDRIAKIFLHYASELERGALLNIEPAKQRIRLLPFTD